MADEDPTPIEPETPAVGMTPSGYQRGSEGGLRWQPPTVEHLQTLLPQYEILALLGHGGMGAVYKARQINLDRPVAIKILPPEAAENDPQFIERFKNEARTMAKMNHPAIVHVYDYGETAEQQLYFVMEFVDGMDVQQMMAHSGTLPPDHALAITAHVCDALQYAHSQGVIHRDIKPGNVLLNREGRVKVADFGLAKFNAADPSTAGLTRSTVVMGTPDYIAPEALAPGMVADHRADLYAVGVMLYRMLTGTIPRGAFSLPSIKQPGMDARFDSIVLKAMQPEREERYQSALEIRQDLDQILSTPVVQNDRTVQAAVPPQAMADRARFQARLEERRRAEAQARAGSSPWLVPTVLIGLVLLGIGGWSLFKPESHLPQASAAKEDVPAAAETSNHTSGAPALPVTPDWVDALALVDPKKHAIRGSVWRRTSEGIEWVSNVQDNMYAGMFELPVALGPSYAVEVEFTGGAADDSIGIVIPVGDGNMTTCWFGADRTSAGLGKVDGKDPWQPGPPEVSSKFSLKQNQRYTAHVEVRRSATGVDIQFLADGKTIGTYHGPADRLTLSHHWHVDVGRTLIMLGCNRPTVFHRARVKELAAAAPDSGTSAAPLAAAPAEKEAPFTNSLGMKFVPVPETQVLFCIHTTRVKDYAAYAAETPGVNSQWKTQLQHGFPISAGSDDPVVAVTWDDASAFCAWLGKREGRSYRLPTDREWSFAVGIGPEENAIKDATPEILNWKIPNVFPWGTAWPPPKGAGNYADTSCKEKFPAQGSISGYTDGFPTTAPVMSFKPNPFGLYDMGGNVTEWCADWYNAAKKERVLRGACWADYAPNLLQSSFRSHYRPDFRYHSYGFRCVMEVTAPK